MNLNDALIVKQALNLDGGEGSGVKGHTTEHESKLSEARAGVIEGKYGGLFTRETLATGDSYLGKSAEEPLKLIPDHESQSLIVVHAGTNVGRVEHTEGKWQAHWKGGNGVQQKHLDILDRAAPQGLKDIAPSQGSLF
jgi:hypothetical protein